MDEFIRDEDKMEVYKLCERCADDLSSNQEVMEVESQTEVTSPAGEIKPVLEIDNDNTGINQVDKDDFLKKK